MGDLRRKVPMFAVAMAIPPATQPPSVEPLARQTSAQQPRPLAKLADMLMLRNITETGACRKARRSPRNDRLWPFHDVCFRLAKPGSRRSARRIVVFAITPMVILAEELLHGGLDLQGRIEIHDEPQDVTSIVCFAEAVELRPRKIGK